MSRLMNGDAAMGVEDNLPDAYHFNSEMIPRWSEKYVPLLTIGQLDIPLPIERKQALIRNNIFGYACMANVP